MEKSSKRLLYDDRYMIDKRKKDADQHFYRFLDGHQRILVTK